MIKVKVTKRNISIVGHAEYDDLGKDIVCAAVSSIVLCSVEAIALFDKDAVDVLEEQDRLEIIINKDDDITNNLIKNMLNCLTEVEKKYSQNIKIINKEE